MRIAQPPAKRRHRFQPGLEAIADMPLGLDLLDEMPVEQAIDQKAQFGAPVTGPRRRHHRPHLPPHPPPPAVAPLTPPPTAQLRPPHRPARTACAPTPTSPPPPPPPQHT